jgi:hypothetical protein
LLHYPKRGARKSDLIFDERTIRLFSRTLDRKGQASQALGIGAGEGDTMLRRSRQSVSATAKYGLTQTVYTNKDVKVASTLQAHVDRIRTIFQHVPEQFSITVGTSDPPLFSWQLGDEAQLRWPSPYDPVNKFVRIVGFDVIWQSGEEQAVLHLEAVGL